MLTSRAGKPTEQPYGRREEMDKNMATDKQHDKDLELLAEVVRLKAKTVEEAAQIILDHRTCTKPPEDNKKE